MSSRRRERHQQPTEPTEQQTNTMKKQLSHFRHMDRKTIATLDGMKSIMRVETPRTTQWWIVLPAVGDSDATCVLIRKITQSKFCRKGPTLTVESQILESYADRVA
jgi:hypothetical protein